MHINAHKYNADNADIIHIYLNLYKYIFKAGTMSYQNQSFGMMDAGYFVPRGQILDWINNLLKLNITKIQVLGSGAIYCQLVDVIHPNKVALNKVNWKARSDYQFIGNLKILQNAFDKIGIKKHVEVEKLAKAKYQDNLQFIQWLKRYYDLNCGERGNNYMAEQRRGNAPIDFSFAEKTVVPKTYNASGVAKEVGNNAVKAQKVEKVQKPRPTTTATTSSKVQQGPSKLKSPRQKIPQQKKPEQKPATKTTKTQAKTQTKTQAQVDNQQHSQKVQKQVIIQYQTDPKLQQQLQKAFAQLQQAKEQSQMYQSKYKKAEMKLQMIKQILGTEDDAAMKISLIQEIYKE